MWKFEPHGHATPTSVANTYVEFHCYSCGLTATSNRELNHGVFYLALWVMCFYVVWQFRYVGFCTCSIVKFNCMQHLLEKLWPQQQKWNTKQLKVFVVSVALWRLFCNVNMLYDICWTVHFWRLLFYWSGKNKFNLNLFIFVAGFPGHPTLSPHLTIGFEFETSHLNLTL